MVWRQRNSFNKYHATSSSYNGMLFHSKKEAAYAAELDLRKKAGEIESWTRQHRLPLDVNGFHITNYFIDFVVIHKEGLPELVEVKGFETPEWKLKWKLCEALYSDRYRLTVIK